MGKDFSRLSDEELISLSRTRPWEDRLLSGGCLVTALGVVVFYVLTIAAAATGYPFGPVFLLFCLVLVFSWFVDHIAHARTNGPRKELGYRYSPRSMERSIREALALMQAPNGPDWVLLLRGRALPYGGTRDIDISVWAGERRASATVRGAAMSDYDDKWPFRGTTGGGELSQEICDRSLGELDRIPIARQLDKPWGIKDGFPCKLTVLRKDPPLQWASTFNMSASVQQYAEHPGRILMRLMLDACNHFIDRDSLRGGADPPDDIRAETGRADRDDGPG